MSFLCERHSIFENGHLRLYRRRRRIIQEREYAGRGGELTNKMQHTRALKYFRGCSKYSDKRIVNGMHEHARHSAFRGTENKRSRLSLMKPLTARDGLPGQEYCNHLLSSDVL